jgi:hypothetical protein
MKNPFSRSEHRQRGRKHDDANGQIFEKPCCKWAKICENMNWICPVQSNYHKQVLAKTITGRQVSSEKGTSLSS